MKESSFTIVTSVSVSVLSAVKKEPPGYELAEKKADARTKSKVLDGFIHDLEVYLHERDYDHFARLILEFKEKQKQHTDTVSDLQQSKVIPPYAYRYSLCMHFPNGFSLTDWSLLW